MPSVSVVVPVYNMEEYLDRCVQSLVDQTLSDIEIILVDDGSSDSSPRKCDEWAGKDTRIRVLHKENGGLSDARNVGARSAQADFVGFVDSDDFVDASMFEELLKAVEAHGVDLATCDVTYEPSGRKEEFERPVGHEGGVYVLDPETALREAVLSRLPRIWAPTKIYARRLFDEGFCFPVGKTYEDAYVIVDLMSRVEAVSVDPRGFYHYVRHGGETITTAAFNERSFDVVDAWDNCSALIDDAFPSLREEIDFRCYWARYSVLDKMLLSGLPLDDPRLKALVASLRESAPRIISNAYVGRGRKLATRFLRHSVLAYKQLSLLEAKRKERWWNGK